ncbi:MAG: hypothetical protein IKV17_01905 [Bacteroidaceae bacterium]|nr:hypothetical protein [Bacteroidaceae bacterium]
MITHNELKAKVRLLLNEEDGGEVVTLLSDDTRNIDDYIESLLPEAVLFVQKSSRVGGVNPKSSIIGDRGITVAEDGSGYFKLPNDFVRLISFAMRGWERPCNKIYPADSVVAMAQRNKYTRAGWSKPVCVEGFDKEAARVIYFYSLPPDTEPFIEELVYDTVYVPTDGLRCDDRHLIEAVAYQCAALLYNVFEKRDTASLFFSMAAALCNGSEPNKK